MIQHVTAVRMEHARVVQDVLVQWKTARAVKLANVHVVQDVIA